MSYMKEYYNNNTQCCDGVDLCVDCDYNISTMDMNPIPSFEDWYKEVTKNAEEKIREYFKKQKQKKKLELPF